MNRWMPTQKMSLRQSERVIARQPRLHQGDPSDRTISTSVEGFADTIVT